MWFTPDVLPLEELFQPEELAYLDKLAAEHGLTREAAAERLAGLGYEAVMAGAPLPPIDPPANDDLPASGPRGTARGAG